MHIFAQRYNCRMTNWYTYAIHHILYQRKRQVRVCHIVRIFRFLPSKRHEMLKYLGFAALMSMFFSCNSDSGTDLTDYYFPIEKLSVPVTYTYIPVQDTLLEDVVWQYAASEKEGRTFLRGENLDRTGRPVQVNEEEITGSGVLLRSLQLISYDSTGQPAQIDAGIEGNNVFPFSVQDSTLVYFYKVEWNQAEDSLVIALTRNRRYLGKTTYTVGDTEYPAVRFLLRELLTTDREGMTKSQWAGEEIYAKGIGLVYYRKEISKGYILEYALKTNPFQRK